MFKSRLLNIQQINGRERQFVWIFYFNLFSFGFLEILDYFDNINTFNSGWIDVESFSNIVAEKLSQAWFSFNNLTIFCHMQGQEEIEEIVGIKLFSSCNFKLNWKLWNSFQRIRREQFFEYSTRDKSSSSECPSRKSSVKISCFPRITFSLNTTLHLDSLENE